MIDLKLSKKIFNTAYYPYLLQYREPIEVYYGGSGSGKSVFIAQKILVKALNDKRRVFIIRKVQSTLKESCWRLLLNLLEEWKIYHLCKIRISDMTIELPNGSLLLFKGLDDPEKVKSLVDVSDIWIEEATELTEYDYIQLSLRIRDKKEDLQIFCSFNPISKVNWVYKRWFAEEAVETPFILRTTYKDNKFLPKSYIERLEELINTNPTYHKIYALGEFVSLDKLVFTNWEVREFDYREIKGDTLIGLDFGFSNDTAALIASIQTDSEIYVFCEWGETNFTNPQLADIIKYLGFSKSTIIADSAEPKSIKEIKDEGIYKIRGAEKGPDSVRHGIQTLQQYKIIIHPSCVNVRTEFENYAWKKDKKTGEYINEPVDAFNHWIDALRYSLQCTKKRLKTLPKSALGV